MKTLLLLLSIASADDRISVYHECLKLEREKLVASAPIDQGADERCKVLAGLDEPKARAVKVVKPQAQAATQPIKAQPKLAPEISEPKAIAESEELPAPIDQSACQSSQREAANCCSNPMSCASELSQSDQDALKRLQSQTATNGISGACQQLEAATHDQGQVNLSFAAICADKKIKCQTSCQSDVCSRLSAKQSQLSQQGLSSGSYQVQSTNCGEMSSSNKTTEGKATSTKVDTTVRPRNEAYGPDGFSSPGVQGSLDVPTLPEPQSQPMAVYAPHPSVVNPIPNNSSGWSQAAANSPQASPSGRVRVDQTNVDIMQASLRSGGYSQPSSSDTFGTEVNSAEPTGVRAKPFDLKRYLPGSGRRPALAGLADDIFLRISNKMSEKCKLGILWECQP